MIGYYGDIIFEVSSDKILSLNNFTRDTSSRFNKHDTIGTKPKLEYLGPDLDAISFSINLNSQFGVSPRVEMEKWLVKARSGTADILVIGNKALGVDKWIVKNVSQMWGVITANGKVLNGNLDIQLEEYVSDL